MPATLLERLTAAQDELKSALDDVAEKSGGEFSPEDRARINGLAGTVESLKTAAGADQAINEMKRMIGDSVQTKAKGVSWDEALFKSAEFDRIKASGAGKLLLPGLAANVLRTKAQPLMTGATTGAGEELAVRQDLGITVTSEFRTPTLLDLITTATSDADVVTWIEMLFTNNAAVVTEATAATKAGATGGLKPDSANSLVERQATVTWLAHLKYATRQILSNHGQLVSTIENELIGGLREKAESLIVSDADYGIANVSGTQAQAFDQNVRRTLLQARSKVMLQNGIPQGVAMNPVDAVDYYDTKDSGGWYYNGGPTSAPIPMAWDMRIVESPLVPQGTAYVGDFRSVIMYEREAPATEQTNSHLDFFARNIEAIRAEMAAIYTIQRPDRIVIAELS